MLRKRTSTVHGNLQNERDGNVSNAPLFSSCPGCQLGGGRRSPAKRRTRGAKRLDGQRAPGGCAACAECLQARGLARLARWPLHRQARGASWSFSCPISSFGLHTRFRASLPWSGAPEITSRVLLFPSAFQSFLSFSSSSSHLPASTLAPAAHAQRHPLILALYILFYLIHRS
jgi:hypothetical protein